ncbi:hypothetical protein M193_gp029 [Halorubrum tailed phage 7]|uniref:hypothetical protein n=1 Tax=Halorubrum tailed phage 7 TaxID=2847108 RepID=UPI0003348EF1|nr:hypothetical protein M193_gp029 [Halorubrum tailed phage 7]AGM10901.1 hypothetical protein HRTV7_29 [Halorubrum tailed phage 7]
MPKDLALNQFFSVYLDPDTLDIATVEGREAFEQAVVITLNRVQEGLFGDTGSDSIEQKLRQSITRVARRYGEIEGIEQLKIERKSESSDTYQVTVVYNIGSAFSEEVTL